MEHKQFRKKNASWPHVEKLAEVLDVAYEQGIIYKEGDQDNFPTGGLTNENGHIRLPKECLKGVDLTYKVVSA